MKISTLYEKKRQMLSFEIYPPKKDTVWENIDETLGILCDCKPDFISVTFGAGGTCDHNRTIELARKIKEDYHVEPLVHLTCLSYTQKEIDAFVEELKKNNLQNILALRGDKNPLLPAKEDFLHATDLTRYLKAKGDFCVAGACYPEKHQESYDVTEDMNYLKEKEKAGDAFFISQLFFENAVFDLFVKRCMENKIKAPLIPGIMPIVRKTQIEKTIKLCGATIPVELQKILARYGDKKEALFDAGIHYALQQAIDLLAGGAEGIHLYTMNDPVVAQKIADGVKNILAAQETEATA